VDFTSGVYLSQHNIHSSTLISFRESSEYKYRLLVLDLSGGPAFILNGDHEKSGFSSDGFMAGVDQLVDNALSPTERLLYWFGRTHGTKIPFLQTYNTNGGTKCAIGFQFGSQQAPDDPEAYFVTRYSNRKTVLAVNMNTEVLVIFIKLTTVGSCPSSSSSDLNSRSLSLPSSTNGLHLK